METGCQGCRTATENIAIEMAFQPIVDADRRDVFAYEALVRGRHEEGAAQVLSQVTPKTLYAFDQQCRVSAIRGAVDAGILDTQAKLSINFLPKAIYSPLACIQQTLQTARETGLATDRLIFEFTENEQMISTDRIGTIIECYREMGFTTAIDDFGAGHSGLNLLASLKTDYLKIDMGLVREIDERPRNRSIVEGLVDMGRKLDATLIAEGIETEAEYRVLRDLGLRYFQGYLFAKPAFRSIPKAVLPQPRFAE